MKEKSKSTVYSLILCALFAALIAVGAFIKIPVPFVPFTLQLLFTTLAGIVLGPKYGALSVGVYILIGLCGVPIFTQGGGPAYVLQPTFGYLIGFLIGTFVTGLIVHKVPRPSIQTSFGCQLFRFVDCLYTGNHLLLLHCHVLHQYLCRRMVFVLILFLTSHAGRYSYLCCLCLYRKTIGSNPKKGETIRMNTVQTLKEKAMQGVSITKEEALSLADQPLDELCQAANELREHFCDNVFDLCSIINGKSGKCSENCKYCAQSSHFCTAVEEYPLLDSTTILQEAQHNYKNGILRFSVVTSGRALSDQEVDDICKTYRRLKDESGISLCASHGLLTYPQFVKLKEAGVTRYHNNLETSRRNFPNICTTHTYDDKIQAIKHALKAGLEVCSGGIMGLGETMEDRIDMVIDIRELGITSVPVNVLNPIPGTPFAELPKLTEDDLCRIVSIFRFLIPNGAIRLAGGRGNMCDKGKSAFQSGANAAISGDMLTTSGITIQDDMNMLKQLKYTVNFL